MYQQVFVACTWLLTDQVSKARKARVTMTTMQVKQPKGVSDDEEKAEASAPLRREYKFNFYGTVVATVSTVLCSVRHSSSFTQVLCFVMCYGLMGLSSFVLYRSAAIILPCYKDLRSHQHSIMSQFYG